MIEWDGQYVVSLINSDGWVKLLKPYMESMIDGLKDELTSSESPDDRIEMTRINRLRSIINVYSELLNQVESWVYDVNEEKSEGGNTDDSTESGG